MTYVVSVVGARPQFVKAAVVSQALSRVGIAEKIVHTGQHYDETMSGQFLRQLGIDIAANLAVGSGTHAHQTAAIMTEFQDFLDGLPDLPDAVVVYGDTNSTMAAGLVAAKLGVSLVHVEAGLRSYNRAMPEEINRVVVDHLSDLLFCSSQVGIANLRSEGISQAAHEVGDVMLDAFLHFSVVAKAQDVQVGAVVDIPDGFVLATIHRPSNTDDAGRLAAIIRQLGELEATVVWPVHPRNRKGLEQVQLPGNLVCIEPVGYLEMLTLLRRAAAVVTDSGGLQKEAHWAARPCVTLRAETEWTETLDGGWNVLADPMAGSMHRLAFRTPTSAWKMIYGDGNAADRIATGIRTFLHRTR